jgi:tripartite-type tricarboxylate transporter receptor subunit TctC
MPMPMPANRRSFLATATLAPFALPPCARRTSRRCASWWVFRPAGPPTDWPGWWPRPSRTTLAQSLWTTSPGAAGLIALRMVKSAKPDGQTVLILPSGPLVLFPHTHKKLDYDPVKDFTPISQIARFQFGVASGPATNVKSIAEMAAKAKTDPKSATYGSPGGGTLPHFMGALFEQTAGIALQHVPFQGGGPANTALLGGHIGYKFDVVSETAALHRDGKVRIIAVSGATRDPQVPEVPTLREQGIPMEATAWFAMLAPAGLDAATAARLERAVSAGVRKPEVRERMARFGYEVIGSTGAELVTAQRADLARWEKPIKATGFVQE